MGGDADQLLRGVTGQPRVGIERDAVVDGGEDGWIAGFDGEARVGGAPQQPVPFLDLAALALPAHEDALARVPLPHAVDEVEAVVAALGVACVQGVDPGSRGAQDLRVVRHLARGGVREVAQDREVDARIEIAESQHLEVLEQLGDPRDAREQRRHDDHGSRALRHAAQEVEAGKAAWRSEADKQALDDGDRHVARRKQQQQRHPGLRPGRVAVEPRVGEAAAEQEGGQEPDRPEVGGGGMGEHEASRPAMEPGPIRQVGLEIGAALADQVVADVGCAPGGAALLGLARALDGSERHPKLTLPGAVGQILHRLPVAVAAQEVHLAVGAGGVALQHALDQADRFEVLAPVERG
jgi:hypothetical protein